jgi:putative membrane protein
MAWVRTATSLISFAFTIYKFFQYLQSSQPAAVHPGAFGPRAFALAMIALGVGTLVLATIQHHRDLKVLEQQYGRLPRSTAMIVASAVAALGIVVLTLVVFRQ